MKLLNEIQQKIKAPKTQYNNFGKYHYRSCSDILSAVKPLLGQAFITMSDDLVSIGGRNYVRSTVRLWHEGDFIESIGYAREAEEQTGMNAAQLSCSTSSYARKLALSGLFGIDDSHDAGAGNGDKKEPTDINELIEQAHFNYVTENANNIPDGFTCDLKAFKETLFAIAKKETPVAKRKDFAWTADSIKPFIAKMDLKKTLVQNADPSDH